MILARQIATVGGIGHLRHAPGTWGSLAALPLFWVAHTLGGALLTVLLSAVIFAVGLFATKQLTDGGSDHDPSFIVIDEVAGQWIALLPLSISATLLSLNILVMWPGWISAFVLFRLFDIWKPGPVGWADMREDAVGVMLDDVIAGALAALGVLVLAAVAHSV